MADLKKIQGLIDDIEGAGLRGVLKQWIADLVLSLSSVYGVSYLTNPATTFTTDGSWTNFDQWEQSRDTRGLVEDLAEGWYTLKANADGKWEVEGFLYCTVDTAGTYRWRPRLIRADLSEVTLTQPIELDLSAGEKVFFHAIGLTSAANDALQGDHLVMQMRTPNGAIVTPHFGSFRCQRK